MSLLECELKLGAVSGMHPLELYAMGIFITFAVLLIKETQV